jgi:hypothetical protein
MRRTKALAPIITQEVKHFNDALAKCVLSRGWTVVESARKRAYLSSDRYSHFGKTGIGLVEACDRRPFVVTSAPRVILPESGHSRRSVSEIRRVGQNISKIVRAWVVSSRGQHRGHEEFPPGEVVIEARLHDSGLVGTVRSVIIA